MRRLSSHFTDTELNVQDAPERVFNNAIWLCANILEPLRDHFNKPIIVNSGYRSPEHNKAIGGAETSYHIFEGDHCAADIEVKDVPLVLVFNALRFGQVKTPFHKVILERDHKKGDWRCVHIQAHAGNTSVQRQAFVGATHGTEPYIEVLCF